MKINQRVRDYLSLALLFVDKPHEGINMNLIVFYNPSIVHIGDAWEHGMGGCLEILDPEPLTRYKFIGIAYPINQYMYWFNWEESAFFVWETVLQQWDGYDDPISKKQMKTIRYGTSTGTWYLLWYQGYLSYSLIPRRM